MNFWFMKFSFFYLCLKITTNEGVWDEMVTILGNGQSDLSSNLNEAVCISQSANALGKSMNLTILPPAMGK